MITILVKTPVCKNMSYSAQTSRELSNFHLYQIGAFPFPKIRLSKLIYLCISLERGNIVIITFRQRKVYRYRKFISVWSIHFFYR